MREILMGGLCKRYFDGFMVENPSVWLYCTSSVMLYTIRIPASFQVQQELILL